MKTSAPEQGAVLGIDVGWSRKKATTGMCLLKWGEGEISWQSCEATLDQEDRLCKLNELVHRERLLAVGIDGPLVPGLEIVVRYRAAEALLSRGVFQRRGKPGPTNGGSGPCLHEHATRWAILVANTQDVAPASYPYKVHRKALVEAFPNAFLSVLHSDKGFPGKPKRKRRWTDTLFPLLTRKLRELLKCLLPSCKPNFDLDGIKGHEEIASFLCALTALGAVSARCVVVGDQRMGYIVLPPLELWGLSVDGSGAWAKHVLQHNLTSVRAQAQFESVVLYKDNEVGVP